MTHPTPEPEAAPADPASPFPATSGEPTRPLRVVPTPDREPGRDLGLVQAVDREQWSAPANPPPETQGTLALTFVLPSGLPSEPGSPALRLVRRLPEPSHESDEDFGPRRTSRADLPDPALWAPRFLQAVVDVLAGDRPAQQLLRWTTDDVYAQIRHTARRQAHAAAVRRPAGRRAAVRSSRVFEPTDGIAEACGTVRYLDRVRTVAFRLEGSDGRWRCTVLQFG